MTRGKVLFADAVVSLLQNFAVVAMARGSWHCWQLAAADLTAAAACSVSAGGADRQLAVHGSQSAVLLLCHG